MRVTVYVCEFITFLRNSILKARITAIPDLRGASPGKNQFLDLQSSVARIAKLPMKASTGIPSPSLLLSKQISKKLVWNIDI